MVKLSGLRKQGHFQNNREPAALCFDSDQLVQREGLLPSSLEGPQVNKIPELTMIGAQGYQLISD